MMRRWVAGVGLVAAVWFVAGQHAVQGQRTGYSAEEFARRRQVIMKETGGGLIVLFGNDRRDPGTHFRQDNDFFYLTGRDDVNAILVMVPKTGASHLFLPEQNPREIMIDGPNLLKDPKGAERAGMTAIYGLGFFDEFLARNLSSQGHTIHMRLSPRDALDGSRSESDLFYARRSRIHYNDQLPIDYYRIAKMKDRYPSFAFVDITPAIDAMRVIKSAEEIAVLRRNGRVSAEAVKQAMLASRPGVFEYELEAAAIGTVLKHGAKGPAYAPIVGSGPNSCVWHYDENGRQTVDGDIVLMDFGADLDHQAMDITRTWPVNGVFTKEQREVYQLVLEVQKACIEAYKPGVTNADVQQYVADRMKAKGIDPGELRGGFGHGVGLATHDVPLGPVLREGMVFAIEPALYFPEKNLGVRIEDTVLITKDGVEVLTREVPKEIADIEALMATRKR
ncbi:MAG: Xaa-Pro peptidase family protein [Vicinamibacterales bacterium]|nr:Xaa-Pro peptidase family protein [Vicinamibacterales bacterium]